MRIRITYFLAAVLTLSMISCGDDNMTEEGDTALQGTWKAVSLEGTVMSESSFMGNLLFSDSNVSGKNFNYLLTLSNDNTFITAGSYDIELSTEAQGNVLTATDMYTNVSGDGTYTYTDTEIVLDGSIFDLTVNGALIDVTGGTLPATYSISNGNLTITESKEEITNLNGIMASTKIDMVSVWRKQ